MYSLLLTVLMSAASTVASEPAPPLSVDANQVTVSGISAGGQMATQLHIAYSDVFSGAGIIAGGPYGCAGGSLATAMARCMGTAGADFPVAELAAMINTAAAEGEIADTVNLADDRVWLFHGTLDTAVASGLSDATVALYSEFMPADQIVLVNDVGAGHNFPARGRGHACAAMEPPYVADCDYDAAGEILGYLYPGLTNPEPGSIAELQTVTLPGAAGAGLSDTAYLFVPPACATGEQACPLHLVLHGCAQSATQVGTGFMEQSGYLPWAQANDIVLAFPQVVTGPANPLACWDWWGYTGGDYRWRNGAQMMVLTDWIHGLSASSGPE